MHAYSSQIFLFYVTVHLYTPQLKEHFCISQANKCFMNLYFYLKKLKIKGHISLYEIKEKVRLHVGYKDIYIYIYIG